VDPQDLRDVAALLTSADNVIVVWGARLGSGERGDGAVAALIDLALLLGLDAAPGSGMIEIPAGTNGRGLREVGCLPALGPGLTDAPGGLGAAQARDAAVAGQVQAFYLLHSDPLRELPGQAAWDAALGAASFVVAHAQFLGESASRHADVVFPGEAYPEKEGTLTHPDGRLQRLRPSIGRPGEVRRESQVLLDLAARLKLGGERPQAAGAVFAELSQAVPFYRGLTLDDIGGGGLRWPVRDEGAAAARLTCGDLGFSATPPAPPAPLEPGDGLLRLAARPALWASWVPEHAPSLGFLAAQQVVELNPLDAERLALKTGEVAEASAGDRSVTATVRVRRAVARGTAVMLLGTKDDNANQLFDGSPVLVEIGARSAAGGRRRVSAEASA
jgi:NADH-quinone oxidoreductase subunit G